MARSSTSPNRLGASAENAVRDHVMRMGYVVLAQNLRVGRLEIDLLARDNDCIVLIEVRFRSPSSWQAPHESLSPTKRQRLRLAAERLWQKRFASDPSVNRLRFDVAAVTPGPERLLIEYFRGADL